MISVYLILLACLELCLIHGVMPMGSMPNDDCMMVTEPPRMNETFTLPALDVRNTCFDFDGTDYYIVFNFTSLMISNGKKIIIRQNCHDHKYHKIAKLTQNTTTDQIVIGNEGCRIRIRFNVASSDRFSLNYEFIRDCPVFGKSLYQINIPISMACDGTTCGCIRVEGTDNSKIIVRVNEVNLKCGERRCRFYLQISEIEGGEELQPRNIPNTGNVTSSTSGVDVVLKLVKSNDRNNGSAEVDVSYTFIQAEVQTTMATTTSTTLTPLTTNDVEVQRTVMTTTSTTRAQLTREKTDRRSDANTSSTPWIIVVIVIIILAATGTGFICIRKRRKGCVDCVNSSFKQTVVNNATYSQDDRGLSTTVQVNLGGDNVTNSAYQSVVRRESNNVAVTSAGNSGHGYAYVGTNDESGAYQSADDNRSKLVDAQRDAEHEYAYADTNDMPSSENDDNQKGQVYNFVYQNADGIEDRAVGV